MQFAQIDHNGIYIGMIGGIAAAAPDVGFYAPEGVKVSPLGTPPANEPGKWRDDGATWVEVTQDDLLKTFTAAIQAHLDRFAQTRNYDGIMSAATYATSTVAKFRAEGQYAVEARDLTWAKGYAIMDEVMSGARPMPTIDEVLAELPALAWPDGA